MRILVERYRCDLCLKVFERNDVGGLPSRWVQLMIVDPGNGGESVAHICDNCADGIAKTVSGRTKARPADFGSRPMEGDSSFGRPYNPPGVQ